MSLNEDLSIIIVQIVIQAYKLEETLLIMIGSKLEVDTSWICPGGHVISQNPGSGRQKYFFTNTDISHTK